MSKFTQGLFSLDNAGLLYAGTALFWGSGALVTTTQVATGAPEPTVALRMLLLWPLALAASWARGERLLPAGMPWRFVAAQGAVFFGLAFIAFYHATSLIPSGLAALVLSTSSVFAGLFGRIFLHARLNRYAILGILLGLSGLVVIVLPGMSLEADSGKVFAGLAWAALAAAATGGGALLSQHIGTFSIPPFAQMGWGAFFGGCLALALAVANPATEWPSMTLVYLGGFAYMLFGASFLCFSLYLRLIGKVGAARASYVMTAVPLIALMLSAIFENYIIGPATIAGAAAIIGGNLLIWRS
jgi:drug/metabolite transporter (DMT)-like permease